MIDVTNTLLKEIQGLVLVDLVEAKVAAQNKLAAARRTRTISDEAGMRVYNIEEQIERLVKAVDILQPDWRTWHWVVESDFVRYINGKCN